jgi:hypothetical protein
MSHEQNARNLRAACKSRFLPSIKQIIERVQTTLFKIEKNKFYDSFVAKSTR